MVLRLLPAKSTISNFIQSKFIVYFGNIQWNSPFSEFNLNFQRNGKQYRTLTKFEHNFHIQNIARWCQQIENECRHIFCWHNKHETILKCRLVQMILRLSPELFSIWKRTSENINDVFNCSNMYIFWFCTDQTRPSMYV